MEGTVSALTASGSANSAEKHNRSIGCDTRLGPFGFEKNPRERCTFLFDNSKVNASFLKPCRDEVLLNDPDLEAGTDFVRLLKACINEHDLHRIHSEIFKRGLLEKSFHVVNTLLHMYAKFDMLSKAQQSFDGLTSRDVVSWNSLIAGYSQHGHGEKALSFFEHMQDAGFSPDAVTFVCVLKACGSIKALEKGKDIHVAVLTRGLLNQNICLGTALVDMYSKCGMLMTAQLVFDELPTRNLVSWNTLITAYVQHGHTCEAFNCFVQMQMEGFYPNAVTFICILKACGDIQAVEKGKQIHAEIDKQGVFANDVVLRSVLMDMYAKCGMLAKAQQIFKNLPARDTVSWNVLIAAYIQHGLNDEALHCLTEMLHDRISPNSVTLIFVLKACAGIGAVEKGKEVHAMVAIVGGLQKDPVLGNALVDMYAKCGALVKAQELFDELPVHTVVSWNTVISGYVQHGHDDVACNCFLLMQYEGFSPDAITFICVLDICSPMQALELGKEIHAKAMKQGLLGTDTVLGNLIVDMYTSCGALAKGQGVFDELPIRDVISWSTLIARYFEHGQSYQALTCYRQMQYEGLDPNLVTIVYTLKACSSLGAVQMGEEIHGQIYKRGLLEENVIFGTGLVDMYAKCGVLSKAQEVFDALSIRDVVTWTALIAGYVQNGRANEALSCFGWMQNEGVPSNDHTLVCILSVYGTLGAVEKGEELHKRIVRHGLHKNNMTLMNALMDMYCKCGAFLKAENIFNELPMRDIISWSVLIAGYSHFGYNDYALECFGQMLKEGIFPDAASFVCVVKACGSIGVIEKAKEMHVMIMREGLLEELGTALVDMHAKCGALAKAKEVFDSIPVLDLMAWNALIAGYAFNGKVEMVFDLLRNLLGDGMEPDLVTLALLLAACTHVGLVEDGEIHFRTINTTYNIDPTLEHHICMVDLFSRAGHFEKAVSMILELSPNCCSLWYVLLGACKKWVDVGVGRWAFKHAIQFDEDFTTPYVCMNNIYASLGM